MKLASILSFCLIMLLSTVAVAQERHGGGEGGHGNWQPQGRANDWHRNYWHGNDYWQHRNEDFAGRVVGGAIGGVITNWFFPPPAPVVIVQPPPVPEMSLVQFCMNKYKSYNPNTGTYMGYDGQPHACVM